MSNVLVELDELIVRIYRGEEDGKLVVEIEGPGDGDTTKLGSPDIRVWLNEVIIYEVEDDPEVSVPGPEPYMPPGMTKPPDDKPIPHVDVVLGSDSSIVLLFEEGVPMELQNFIRRRLDQKYIGLHLSQARVSQIEAEVNFILVDLAQYGIVLRNPSWSKRVWDFEEHEAMEWAKQKDNPPPVGLNIFPKR